MTMLTRRRFVRIAAAGAGAMLVAPQIAFARVATDRRFVFVIQRGAADGLNIVVPYADPAYASLRGALAVDTSASTKLDGTFALHPSLAQIGQMYGRREALFVHAVASPYRDRSHFDGQNVLETGGSSAYQVKDGWLNRLVGMMPGATSTTRENAIAFAPTVPMALRGAANVASYAPSGLPQAPDDLLTRVSQLYEQDAQLRPLWESAMAARGLAGDASARQDPASLGKLAAGFLSREDGPRIAMIETGGWDTHSAQMPRLAAQLKALDTMLAALRDGLGPTWSKTTVLVATEFGRTAAANGTGGTDHGTASVAMVIGGAVAGGRVIADWPGLRQSDLYQARDLKPTASLDALISGVASDSLGLDPHRTSRTLFAQAGSTQPMTGLIRV
ncbi:putative exported protein [Paraburkholderia caribensis MBA4]|uniref:Putative exported protein n=2 Tax=Paraburkholderia caribensis TaxID=75105 RepID=A0A0P0RGS6_9BURK|nr:putative exported protein [Paraburkholderia caribensis MBA4]